MAKLILWTVVKKISLVYSNVPGPRKPMVYFGKETKKMMFFVPGIGTLSAGISIISHVDVLKIGCISDVSRISDP